jgi:hypothetical protein
MTLSVLILYLIIVTNFLLPFCVRYLGLPDLPTDSKELFILVLFTITYLKTFFVNKTFNSFNLKIRNYIYFLLLFVFVAIINSFVNQNNFVLVIKAFIEFTLIIWILFLAVLEMDINEKNQKKIIKFIFILIFIQIPVTTFQYTFFTYVNPDSNSGTLSYTNEGGTGVVSMLMLFLLSLIIIKMMYDGFNIKWLFFALLTIVPALFGGAKFGLILAPVVVLLTIASYYFLQRNINLTKMIRTATILTGFLIISFIIIVVIAPDTKYRKEFSDLDIIFSTSKIDKYEKGDPKFGRTVGYSKLFNNTYKNNYEILFGLGSSVIQSSNVAGVNDDQLDFVAIQDSVKLLATVGLLGLISVIGAIFYSIPIIKQYLNIETSKFMIVVASSLIPSTFIFIISIFYTPAWSTQIGMSYWIILGIIYQRYSVLSRHYEKLSQYYFSFMNSP